MGRGGDDFKNKGYELLYGPASGLPARSIGASQITTLKQKFEDFRQLMIRNTDRSDPMTDASDFLADFMHWQKRYEPHLLLSDAQRSQLYRDYRSSSVLSLDPDRYSFELDPERTRPGLVELSDYYLGDDGVLRAERIDSEMKLFGLEPEETAALFRVWCEELGLDFNQVYDRAELAFRADP